MSTTTITVNAAQVAAFVAGKLAPLAVPSPRLRPDIGAIQIDRGIIVEHYEEHPTVRLQFDTAAGMGVELNVRLAEFAADPATYMRDLLENLQGIQHAAQLRRAGRQTEIEAMHEHITLLRGADPMRGSR
ncbi:hypothetical protein SAMN05216201_10982 [Pseudomonas linyingensis]|uniref:Uncharacterized protein n=1 Tax=Pseudomonas linyingensis TaxID=915471 RepID=A0A1H6YZG3_9PSED|nr:hypothetical protein [Pseudomonas linyingensis]SEJ46619.1 hypothetical protein SAMN05216201_10982 [Pseudomonas linyingensis]